MNLKQLLRVPLLAASCAYFLVTPQQVLVAQDTPPPRVTAASRPQPAPGSWWLQRRAKTGDVKIELITVEDDAFVTRYGDRTKRYTNEWNAFDGRSGKTGKPIAYRPRLSVLSFPLWPGKKWEQKVRWQSGSASGTFMVRQEVKTWEKVSVPAGDFETLRIEGTAGRNKSICWYAVEV
jgi:hypothetical protein